MAIYIIYNYITVYTHTALYTYIDIINIYILDHHNHTILPYLHDADAVVLAVIDWVLESSTAAVVVTGGDEEKKNRAQ